MFCFTPAEAAEKHLPTLDCDYCTGQTFEDDKKKTSSVGGARAQRVKLTAESCRKNLLLLPFSPGKQRMQKLKV